MSAIDRDEILRLKDALEKIAGTPGCPQVIYNTAADALCWARKHYPNDGWQSEDDKPIPEDAAIAAAFPTRTGRHDLYAEAMRLVGAKYTKGALVALVNWLLHRTLPPPVQSRAVLLPGDAEGEEDGNAPSK